MPDQKYHVDFLQQWVKITRNQRDIFGRAKNGKISGGVDVLKNPADEEALSLCFWFGFFAQFAAVFHCPLV